MNSFSPSHKVVFRELATGKLKFDASADIVSIQTSKNYGRGVGTWKIILTSKRFADGATYYDNLSPNDLVEIRLSAGGVGDKQVVVMAGLIDRVAYSRSLSENGVIVRNVVLTGSDLGKLLMSELGWDISAAQMQIGTQNFVNWVKRYVLLAGTPASLILEIFNIAAADVPPIARLIDTLWITYTDDWHTLNESGYLIEQTAIWEAMKRLANEPWNTLYADFDDDSTVLHLGLEKTPIDENGCVLRDRSKTISTDEAVITNTDLGISDTERINLLSLQTPMNDFVSGGIVIDINLTHTESTKLDQESIRIHGFRPHVMETQFFPSVIKADLCKDPAAQSAIGDVYPRSVTASAYSTPKPTGIPGIDAQNAIDVIALSDSRNNVYKTISERVQHMWNWFSKNHTYTAGSYSMHGLPRARAGWKLVDESLKMSFLIENVSHNYVVHPLPQFTTQLQVTHGVLTAKTR